MKKLKKIVSVALMMVMVCLLATGCGGLKGGPESSAATVGNGGLAVIKGEWLYFVNGYKSKTENYGANKFGNVSKSGIYRVKTENASYNINTENPDNPVLEFNYGTLNVDDAGNLIGAERVVSMKVGFEYGGFYIFGNYIYYVTPGNRYNKDNTERPNDLDLYRVKLDGTDNKKITSIEDFQQSGKYSLYESGKDVYGVLFNGSKIIITKNDKVKQTVENVKQAVMPNISENYNGQKISGKNEVWYTTAGGTTLNKYVPGDEPVEVSVMFDSAASLMGVAGGKLVYQLSNFVYKYGNDNYLFPSSATEFYIIDENVIVEKKEAGLTRRQVGVNIEPEAFIADNINIEFINGTKIYYIQDNQIKRVDINTGIIEILYNEENLIKADRDVNLYFDGSFVYYYKMSSDEYVTQDYYLERLSIVGDNEKTSVALRLGDDNVIKEDEEE